MYSASTLYDPIIKGCATNDLPKALVYPIHILLAPSYPSCRLPIRSVSRNLGYPMLFVTLYWHVFSNVYSPYRMDLFLDAL